MKRLVWQSALALAVLLATACGTSTSAEPTAEATVPAPTSSIPPTPSPIPEATPPVIADTNKLEASKMQSLVASVETTLGEGYSLAPDANGNYYINKAGTRVTENLTLLPSGDFWARLPDKKTTYIFSNLDVFTTKNVAGANVLRAATFELDATGNLQWVFIDEAYWSPDSLRITSKDLQLYHDWLNYKQMELHFLDSRFAKADLSMPWLLEQNDPNAKLNYPFDFGFDGLLDHYDPKNMLYPSGNVTWEQIPVRGLPLFVHVMDLVDTGLFPTYVRVAVNTSTPTGSGVPAYTDYLFPSATDISQVEIGSALFRKLDEQSFGDANISGKIVVPLNTPMVSFGSTTVSSAATGIAPVTLFKEGVNPTEEAARLQILQSRDFSTSHLHLWPVYLWRWYIN